MSGGGTRYNAFKRGFRVNQCSLFRAAWFSYMEQAAAYNRQIFFD
jgi:hypothetical protein